MTIQREFKFRAWDKDYKQMIRVDQLILEPMSHEWGVGVFDEHNDFHKMEDIVLMQYTGIKDIAGNEIYEYDILQFLDLRGRRDELLVKYENGSYFESGYDNLFHAVKYGDAKIIGNIYENNDLFIN